MLNLKDALDRGDALIGTFSTSGSPVMVETLGYAGFDFVVIDCEHSAVSPYGPELEGLIRAAWAAGICAVVRTTWNNPGQILKAVDMGASAVVVPHVNTAEEAAAAVAAAYHHPKGRRSATPAVLGSRRGFVDWPAHYRRAQRDTVVIALIEEPEGVENVEAIAAVPNLGGIFFGPFDLAVRKGLAAEAYECDVSAERTRVYAAARANGLPMLDLAWSPHAALELLRAGASAVTVGVDVSLFAETCRALADGCADVKRRLTPTPDGVAPPGADGVVLETRP